MMGVIVGTKGAMGVDDDIIMMWCIGEDEAIGTDEVVVAWCG